MKEVKLKKHVLPIGYENIHYYDRYLISREEDCKLDMLDKGDNIYMCVNFDDNCGRTMERDYERSL